MAVFRIERTKDYTVMSNHHPAEPRTIPQGKGASFHDVIPA